MKNPEDPTKTINTRLLRRVQRAILKWPEAFDIDRWGEGMKFRPGKKAPDCGTTACIAGWAVALGQPGGIGTLSDEGIRRRAVALLGVTPGQANDLFTAAGQEGSVAPVFGSARTPKLAVRRIDRFLAAMRKAKAVTRVRVYGSTTPGECLAWAEPHNGAAP